MIDPKWADLRKGQNKIKPELRAELEAYMIDKYVIEELTLREIAELTGRSHMDVKRVLLRHQIELRPRGVRPQVTTPEIVTEAKTSAFNDDDTPVRVVRKPGRMMSGAMLVHRNIKSTNN